MRNFNNNDRGFSNFSGDGFRRNSGRSRGGNNFGSRRSSDRQMFSAVCDKCGADCQLPFRPTGEKPVYCSNCFEKTSGRDGGNRRFDNRNTKDYRQENVNKGEFEAINNKLDQILDLLSKKEDKKEKVKKAKKSTKTVKAVKTKKTKVKDLDIKDIEIPVKEEK